jgi:hypothetical protein
MSTMRDAFADPTPQERSKNSTPFSHNPTANYGFVKCLAPSSGQTMNPVTLMLTRYHRVPRALSNAVNRKSLRFFFPEKSAKMLNNFDPSCDAT